MYFIVTLQEFLHRELWNLSLKYKTIMGVSVSIEFWTLHTVLFSSFLTPSFFFLVLRWSFSWVGWSTVVLICTCLSAFHSTLWSLAFCVKSHIKKIFYICEPQNFWLTLLWELLAVVLSWAPKTSQNCIVTHLQMTLGASFWSIPIASSS